MDTSNSSSKLNVQKPCLKWVGGKTQILGPVMSKIIIVGGMANNIIKYNHIYISIMKFFRRRKCLISTS